MQHAEVVRKYDSAVDNIEIVPSSDRSFNRITLFHKGKAVHEFCEKDTSAESITEEIEKFEKQPLSSEEQARREQFCDHFSCEENGKLYRMLKHTEDPDKIFVKRFCDEHRFRHGCIFEDRNSNYILVEYELV
jgi:hypothetical protein